MSRLGVDSGSEDRIFEREGERQAEKWKLPALLFDGYT